MTRIKFSKKGQQRTFILRVIEKSNCPSLRELARRIDFNYSSLKNYFSEERLLPKDLFEDFCYISQIDKKNLNYKEIEDNWGKSLGGSVKKGKK